MSLLRKLLILSSVLVLVSSCGFSPLHSKNSREHYSVDVVKKMKETWVEHIPGRSGQVLRTVLMDSLNPESTPVKSYFRLIVVLDEREYPVGIQQDRRITRYNIVEEASYSLRSIKTNKIIDKGQIRLVGSYDAVDSDFATFAAKQDTVKRVMEELGYELEARVAAAYSELAVARN